MTDQEQITLDDGSKLLIYKVRLSNEWRWTHRFPNYESLRDGLVAASKGGFSSRHAAKKDFFMHNDYDNETDQKAPWTLIAGIVLAVVTMLAVISYSNRAHSHDIYEGWKVNGQNCCHDVHCFSTPVVQRADGTWWARDRDGVTWLPVPEDVIDFGTDFVGSHACVTIDPDDGEHTVVCAAVGGNV